MTYLSKRFVRLLSLLGLLVLLAVPASAQVIPSMFMYVNWTPNEQLTSVVGDERYVTAQIYIDGNIQFWAVDLTCRIGTGVQLTLVNVDYPENTWGVEGTDFFVTPGETPLTDAYNANGTLKFTITRLGEDNSPVGSNGSDYTLPIATLRFRVNELTTNTLVPVFCASNAIKFYNRNGQLQTFGRRGTFTNLFLRTGYTLKGKAMRQGSVRMNNILVQCTHVLSNTVYETYTLVNGVFAFSTEAGGTPLRQFGLYECVFKSDLARTGALDNQFLETSTYVNLQTPTYDLLPVTLRVGDFAQDNVIDLADLNEVTTRYNTYGPLYGPGDANGDLWVNDRDLVIVAGNFGLDDTVALDASHTVYSLGTDYNPLFDFPNSRVQVGTPNSGEINRLNRFSPNRDFWGTVSPDGFDYAYTSVNRFTNKYQLYIGNTVNGIGRPFPVPPTFAYPEAIAPSWSPDGGMLAWICTTYNAPFVGDGLPSDEGHICLKDTLDVLSNSLTVLKDENGVPIKTEIFPPTWLSYPYEEGVGYALIFSVDGTLRYYDLVSNTQGDFLVGMPSNADMPVIINHWSYGNDFTTADAGPNSYLFYRHWDGSNFELRVVKLDIDESTYAVTNGLSFDLLPAIPTAETSSGTPNAIHMIVDDTDTGVAGVQYYDVSPSLDIMMYDDYEGYNIKNIYFDGAPDEVPDLATHFWTGDSVHFVDGNIGNPTGGCCSDIGFGDWSVTNDVDTLLHAERVTFDWVP